MLFLDNRLYDTTNQLKAVNLKLSVENEQLRNGNTLIGNGTSAASASKISSLEKRVLSQQEELTELHRRKGENSQMIVDLNIKLEKQNHLLIDKDTRYTTAYLFYLT